MNDPRSDNPYPRSKAHLRRAYTEGAWAARSETPPRGYICETKAQRLAWLDGFLAERVARTGRSFDPDLRLGPDISGA